MAESYLLSIFRAKQPMNTPQKVLSNLKVSGNLPSMPQVLVQLLDSCQNPEVKIQAIAHIVDKDAALSAKVLQLVNSAFIGARKAIRSVEQAVVYLGMDTVRNLAISVSVHQVFRRVETNGLLSIDRFWHHSYTNALLAQNIAKTINYPDPSEAYLAGLLHDIGKLLLWMAFPGSYAPLLLKGVRCHDARLAFLEEEKLHVNHCQAGAWLCEEWHLPMLIADAIRYHHHALDEVRQTLPLTKIICLADLLSHNEPDAPECLDAAERLFALPRDQATTLAEGIEEQIDQLADQLGIRIPRLAKTSHDKEPECEEAHKETSKGLISRIRDISQLSGLLDNLLRAEQREQIILAVERGVQILFNEERCLLLLPDEATGRLSAQTSPENSLGREIEGLFFDTDNAADSLLSQAIDSGLVQHSFMEKRERQTPTPLFDAQLQHLLGTEGMAIFPLTCHQRSEGLLLIGLMKQSSRSLIGQAGALQLLANQAAVALQLERIRRQQSKRIIEERLRAATLVARKIGHEINNPLAILRNYLHILERKASQGQGISEEITILDEEMERLARITRGLEDLSRENDLPHLVTVDLQPLLEKILAPFRASLPLEGSADIVLVTTALPRQLKTDPGYLQQILHNLIKNGLEAIKDQGVVTVRAEQVDDKVHIHVEDNGPGISPQQRGELFHAGFSTKNSAHRGLGLSIASALAKQMRGNLQCSPLAGKTIFTLTLPLESP
ncbi:MAG: HDOD domain-containing protein [Desulfobulbus sp.]|nr:HDOD domain-containing protein [Desulfobulbus sp.]